MICIIQARTNSTRLFNKIFQNIEGKYAIQHLIDRIKKSKLLDKIVIATTINPIDEQIVKFCNINNIDYYRGSEKNVLERYFFAAKKFNAKDIMRITSDCILMDPDVIDDMIIEYRKSDYSYYNTFYHGSNGDVERGFPDGFNPEIFTFSTLEYAYQNTTSLYDKEHVTPFIRKKYPNLVGKYLIKLKKKYKYINFEKLHLSLDTPDDLILIRNIYNELYQINPNFNIYDILDYLENIYKKNNNIIYNI